MIRCHNRVTRAKQDFKDWTSEERVNVVGHHVSLGMQVKCGLAPTLDHSERHAMDPDFCGSSCHYTFRNGEDSIVTIDGSQQEGMIEPRDLI